MSSRPTLGVATAQINNNLILKKERKLRTDLPPSAGLLSSSSKTLMTSGKDEVLEELAIKGRRAGSVGEASDSISEVLSPGPELDSTLGLEST